MGKAKKAKGLGKDEDIEEEVSLKTSEENPKGTDKKLKKNKSSEDMEDDEPVKIKGKADRKGKGGDDLNDEIESDSDKPVKIEGKKKKKKKAVESEGSDDESVTQKSKTNNSELKKSKKKKKKDEDSSDDEINVAASSFALLQVDDDNSGDENAQPEESDSEKEDQTAKSKSKKEGGKPSVDQGGKKSKKSKKKKDDDDDEDIEAVLAELAMEYSGKKEASPEADGAEGGKKKKKKGGKADTEVAAQADVEKESVSKNKQAAKENDVEPSEEVEDGEEQDNDQAEGGTVKTAAQKRKEKKEREKLKKKEAKATVLGEVKPKLEKKPEPVEDADQNEGGQEGKKKKKKGKESEKAEREKEKKGPGKKYIAAMQETLKKLREEEERLAREEEERIRKIEAAEEAKREAARLEQERKDKKKQKEKERKERLKAEGKLLTAKQKADRARAQAMLEALKAQGLDVPNVGERKPVRLGTRIRPNKMKSQTSQEEEATPKSEAEAEVEAEPETVQVEIVDKAEEKPKDPDDDVKDSWDIDSSDEEEKESVARKPEAAASQASPAKSKQEEAQEESSSESESESEEESSSEDSPSDDDVMTDAEKKRQKALDRIHKRREEAEKNRTVNDLRAAVVCVLGHVDTGKTKILDKLRRTNVQDGEAGGITQQIGATNVPIDAIREQVKIVKGFDEKTLKIPGLLIIDTPGHESFSNLRSRGSSMCDIAILVVDIMHALEPQTIESLQLLKAKKTPFVVALNKIDRLYDWQTMARKDVRDIIKAQAHNTQMEFENRTKDTILQFAEQGLNAALFYENPDPRSYVSLVPTSAITGEGMGNLLALIVENCQNMLAKRLMYSEELQATVLEVKAIPGLGTTIDAILVNGRLKEGDTMIVAGTDGPIVTQIRSLLMPQPMKELRVKNAYIEYKEVKAAQGVKIAAKELEKAIAGVNLQIAQKPDEVEILKEEVARDLKSALSNVKLSERGVYVQASTLGSLEALIEFLKASKIPYSNVRIGPVVKRDVMKASTMLEHESQYATILAFDVKVERDAQELADSLGVKIFQADIIYHLFDKFMAYREELKQRKRDEFKNIAVFPCMLRVLPNFVFNSRDPIVCGVMIEAGVVKEGTPICVPSKEFIDVGVITSVEINHKAVENARKGMEVCIKIEPIPGEAPKMFGRHFDETDMLVSKISRQSIDACKDYFRDDLTKQDWQLMVELKKTFEIL